MNHRYDPVAFEGENKWTWGMIKEWLASGEDTTATAVAAALADAGPPAQIATETGGASTERRSSEGKPLSMARPTYLRAT